MGSRIKLEIEGLNEVTAKLEALNADMKDVAEKALKKTHSIITEKSEEGIAKHKLTGKTEESLYREGEVEWAGTIAEVSTGFSIRNGGLASIFLIYGTPCHSVSNQYQKNVGVTKGVTADKTLATTLNQKKNASIKKKIIEAQEDIFYDEIRRLNG